MQKRSSKEKDVNETAFSVVAEATGQEAPQFDKAAISAVMAEMGRRGGLKGGKARAEALSDAKRRAIAKKAAAARWSTKKAR